MNGKTPWGLIVLLVVMRAAGWLLDLSFRLWACMFPGRENRHE